MSINNAQSNNSSILGFGIAAVSDTVASENTHKLVLAGETNVLKGSSNEEDPQKTFFSVSFICRLVELWGNSHSLNIIV